MNLTLKTIAAPSPSQLNALGALHQQLYPEVKDLPPGLVAVMNFMPLAQWVTVQDDSKIVGASGLYSLKSFSMTRKRVQNFFAITRTGDHDAWNEYLAERRTTLSTNVIYGFPHRNSLTERMSSAHPDDIYIAGLNVHPDYQRQGIGSWLIQESLKAAWVSGAAHVFASCLEPGPSVRLFQQQGFETLLQARTGSLEKGIREFGYRF